MALVKLLDAFAYVMRQYEIDEGLLFGIEVGADRHLGSGGSLVASGRRQHVGDVRQPVEQVALSASPLKNSGIQCLYGS
jgi:hypothetical protein